MACFEELVKSLRLFHSGHRIPFVTRRSRCTAQHSISPLYYAFAHSFRWTFFVPPLSRALRVRTSILLSLGEHMPSSQLDAYYKFLLLDSVSKIQFFSMVLRSPNAKRGFNFASFDSAQKTGLSERLAMCFTSHLLVLSSKLLFVHLWVFCRQIT